MADPEAATPVARSAGDRPRASRSRRCRPGWRPILASLAAAGFLAAGCGGEPAAPGRPSQTGGPTAVAPAITLATHAPPPAAAPTPTTPGDLVPTGPTARATVVRVVDGDTIIVKIGGVQSRLRYIGMDTPESVKPGTPVQPMALEAAAANRALVEGRSVVLEKDVSEVDQYGRLLRDVWVERSGRLVLVGLELVRTGFARVATYPPDVKYVDELLAAERSARQAGLGLWALSPTPTPH